MDVRLRPLLVLLGAFALVACSGSDDKSSSSSSGGSSSGGSSSGGSSSGGSSSGGSSSGGSSSSSSGGSSSSSSGGDSKKEFGAQCSSSQDCKTDFCIFLKGGSSLGMCTTTCEGDLDCPGLDYECVKLSDAPQKVCAPK